MLPKILNNATTHLINHQQAALLDDLQIEFLPQSWSKASVLEFLSKQDSFVFVAITADEERIPVGFAITRIVAGEAELYVLGVQKERRRCGIGRQLMDTVIAHAERLGASIFFLEVSEHNQAGKKLYASVGFEKTASRRDYYRKANGKHETALLMRRVLTPSNNLICLFFATFC